MDWRYDNTFDSFELNIAPYINSRGILLNDITEVLYIVKVNKTDPDVDAVLSKTLSSGVTKVAGATEADAKLTVQFSYADFTSLELFTPYKVGLGIKTAALTKFLEIGLKDDTLTINPDIIHD